MKPLDKPTLFGKLTLVKEHSYPRKSYFLRNSNNQSFFKLNVSKYFPFICHSNFKFIVWP